MDVQRHLPTDISGDRNAILYTYIYYTPVVPDMYVENTRISMKQELDIQ